MSIGIVGLYQRCVGVVVLCLCFTPFALAAEATSEWGKRAPLIEPNSEMAVGSGRWQGLYRWWVSVPRPSRCMIPRRINGVRSGLSY